MSERLKWAASDEEMRREFYENIHMETAVQHCDRVALRTGLRAQIAVLEDLIAHMRQRYTSPENPTGSYCNEESCWIADKIDALRKELE